MLKRTPFFERTGPRNETMLWRHWAGYAVADRYQMSTKREYYAVRAGAGLLDTSPLYKYRIAGPDAERFLAAMLVRDITRCRVERAQYTMWCDDRGYVVEDGVVLRVAPDEYLLTSAEPNIAWLSSHRAGRRVEITDVSDDYGILAVQGPRSLEVLAELLPEAGELRPFALLHGKVGDAPVIVSRTGYTGELGYEVWVGSADAVAVWDALIAAGEARGLLPYGSVVLHLARIEAGLLLVGVDYRSTRFAWSDEQRATPVELGYGWMLRDGGDRQFLGRAALDRAAPRWRLVGVEVDWAGYQAAYRERSQPAPEDHHPIEEAMQVYAGGEPAGFTTSYAFSPILKRHVALARVPPALTAQGTELGLEIVIDHRPCIVPARVTALPFYEAA